jgi:integrase
MGTLNKRDGIYYGNYVDLRTGRRCQRSLRTDDIKVAKLRLRDLELATTDSGPHPSETLDVALRYFVDVVHATSPEGTVTCYRQKARHLSDEMGSMMVDQINREQVERYIAKRCGHGPESDGAHRHSVHKELIVLRGTLKSARARGTFHALVADVVPPFKSGYVPRETFLTPDQFMALSKHLIVSRPNPKPATVLHEHDRRVKRTLYLLLSGLAACRKGELEMLRWELVDLARNLITVPKSKVRIGGAKARVIPIHPVLRPWLEALHEGTGPLIEPWSSVGRDLPAACRRAGVPRVTLNDLRRTFASWSVQAGVPAKVVANLMGHTSTRMVDLVYGRVGPSDYEAAIARLPGGNQSHAGYTFDVKNGGTHGTAGNAIAQAAIVNSVEESTISAGFEVPRVGIEPTTRGFSVRCSTN